MEKSIEITKTTTNESPSRSFKCWTNLGRKSFTKDSSPTPSLTAQCLLHLEQLHGRLGRHQHQALGALDAHLVAALNCCCFCWRLVVFVENCMFFGHCFFVLFVFVAFLLTCNLKMNNDPSARIGLDHKVGTFPSLNICFWPHRWPFRASKLKHIFFFPDHEIWWVNGFSPNTFYRILNT